MAPLVARTVLLKNPETEPAVKRAELAPMAPPPATTLQVRPAGIGTTLPLASLPTAAYCWVPPVATALGSGLTSRTARDPRTGPVAPLCSHAAIDSAAMGAKRASCAKSRDN